MLLAQYHASFYQTYHKIYKIYKKGNLTQQGDKKQEWIIISLSPLSG
jgi:hypothetical protein